MADDSELSRFINERLGDLSPDVERDASAPLRRFDLSMIKRLPQQDAETLSNAFVAALIARALEDDGDAGMLSRGQIGARDVRAAIDAVGNLIAADGEQLSPQTRDLLARCDLWPNPRPRS